MIAIQGYNLRQEPEMYYRIINIMEFSRGADLICIIIFNTFKYIFNIFIYIIIFNIFFYYYKRKSRFNVNIAVPEYEGLVIVLTGLCLQRRCCWHIGCFRLERSLDSHRYLSISRKSQMFRRWLTGKYNFFKLIAKTKLERSYD